MALSNPFDVADASVRILVAGDRVSLYRELSDVAHEQEADVTLVGFTEALCGTVQAEPDIILIDADHEARIQSLLEAAAKHYPKAKTVLISPHDDESWLEHVVQMGVHYCFLRPFDAGTLLRRLLQTARPDRYQEHTLRVKQRQREVEAQARAVLSEIGMPSHYRGYAYLVPAITMAVHDEDAVNRITSHLYPSVAKRFGVTAAHVERSIRHAIEITWMRGNMQRINTLFAYTINQDKGKPTNGLFIARIADYIRLSERTGPTE